MRLILRESVGLLADERMAVFDAQIVKWAKKVTLSPSLWTLLDGSEASGHRDALDPATRILELTVCDPAMAAATFW